MDFTVNFDFTLDVTLSITFFVLIVAHTNFSDIPTNVNRTTKALAVR